MVIDRNCEKFPATIGDDSRVDYRRLFQGREIAVVFGTGDFAARRL
jgi:hypothetical protein